MVVVPKPLPENQNRAYVCINSLKFVVCFIRPVYMYMVIICFPVCDVIKFEINPNF